MTMPIQASRTVVVGQAVSLRADWQSAQRRLPTAAQLSKLPHISHGYSLTGPEKKYFVRDLAVEMPRVR
jgi:hypothetical protein